METPGSPGRWSRVAPLFAYSIWQHNMVGGQYLSWDERMPPTTVLPTGVAVLGVSEWVGRLAQTALEGLADP